MALLIVRHEQPCTVALALVVVAGSLQRFSVGEKFVGATVALVALEHAAQLQCAVRAEFLVGSAFLARGVERVALVNLPVRVLGLDGFLRQCRADQEYQGKQHACERDGQVLNFVARRTVLLSFSKVQTTSTSRPFFSGSKG